MGFDISKLPLTKVIDGMKQEISGISRLDRVTHPTFSSFLSSLTGGVNVQQTDYRKSAKASLLYTDMRVSAGTPYEYSRTLESTHREINFWHTIGTFEGSRAFMNRLAERAKMPVLPASKKLSRVDQVWVDWVSEAIARSYGFYILEHGTDAQASFTFAKLRNIALSDTSLKLPIADTLSDFIDINLVDIFILSLGLDRGVNRLASRGLNSHEKQILKDVESTRTYYLKNFNRIMESNAKFIHKMSHVSVNTKLAEESLRKTKEKLRNEVGLKMLDTKPVDLRFHGLTATKSKTANVPGIRYCPTPHKQIYFTEAEALAYAKKHFPLDKKLQPYICACKQIHVGHTSFNSQGQRIKKAPKIGAFVK